MTQASYHWIPMHLFVGHNDPGDGHSIFLFLTCNATTGAYEMYLGQWDPLTTLWRNPYTNDAIPNQNFLGWFPTPGNLNYN